VTLAQAEALVKQEVEAWCEKQVNWGKIESCRDGVEELRRNITRYHAADAVPWQMALGLLQGYEVVAKMWRKLDEADKAKLFTSGAYQTLQLFSNPMPIVSAEFLLREIQGGKIKTRRGLEKIERDQGGGFSLHFGGGEGESERVHVDVVVNATGVEHSFTHASPLLQSLASAGHLQPHPHGGVVCDRGSMSVGPHLYALGHAVRGACLMTSSAPLAAALASSCAQDLAEHIPLPPAST